MCRIFSLTLLNLLFLSHPSTRKNRGVFCVLWCLIKRSRFANTSMEKMQNITILRSFACFYLKLYSSLAANSSIHVLQCSTFCPRRLCLCFATRRLKKSLLVICIIQRNQLLQTVIQVYRRAAIGDKKQRGLKLLRSTCSELHLHVISNVS